MVKIVRAALKDCKTCWELSKVPELLTPDKDVVPLRWLESIVKEKQIFLVAKEKSKIVGFIMGERLAGNAAIEHLMSVHPDCRGKGIGGKLLACFENECRKRKYGVIVAYGYKKNPAIMKLLRKRRYSIGSDVVECIKILK